LSSHLLAMSVLLLLPDVRRLARFLVLKRATDPPRDYRLFKSLPAHRMAMAVQVAFALWFLWGGYQGSKAVHAHLTLNAPARLRDSLLFRRCSPPRRSCRNRALGMQRFEEVGIVGGTAIRWPRATDHRTPAI
jgi:hypothetical protein